MGTEAQQLLAGERERLADRRVAREQRQLRPARGLSAVETALLERFAADVRVRVLVLGCSVGRFSAQLYRVAQELHAVCWTSEDLTRCRRAYRRSVFTTCDLCDLVDFAPGMFDAVLVQGDALDELDDDERRELLQDAKALLAQDGLLVFSSLNRDCSTRRPGWPRALLGSPRHPLRSVVRLPRRMRNRRRLSARERCGAEYELRNDPAREFGVLHYYISRDAQERQLADLGYELLDCLDRAGRSVERSAVAERDSRLHYIARA